jgi:hypothetical protein
MLIATLTLPAVALVEQSTTGTLSVSSDISITLTSDIDFTDIAPNTTEAPDDDQTDAAHPAITVVLGSETNEDVDIGIKGAIVSGTLALDNWKYSKDYAKTTIAGLTTSYVEVYGDVDYDTTPTVPFYHWITVPTGTDAGTHQVTVYYKVVTAGSGF